MPRVRERGTKEVGDAGSEQKGRRRKARKAGKVRKVADCRLSWLTGL